MLKILFNLSLFTLSLGQLANLSKSEGLNFYAFDIAITVFSVWGFIYFISRKKLVIPKYLIFLIPFILVAILSLIMNSPKLNTGELLVAGFYLFRFIIYFMAGVIVYNMLIGKLLSTKYIENSLILNALIVCVSGFIQLFILPDFTKLDPSLGWDPHQNRLAGTFFDPNFVGAYLSIILAILLNKITQNNYKNIDVVLFFIFVLCLGLTFSRSAWIMFGAIIFIFGVFRNRSLLILSLILMFLAYFAIPRVQTRLSGITDPSDSAHFRFISWGNALTIAKDNLLVGVGFNTYRYAQRDYGFLNGDTIYSHSGSGADSSMLFVLVTTGVVGFILFLVWWLYPILSNIFINKRDLVVLSVMVGLTLESQFINSIFYPQILFLVLVVLGMSTYIWLTSRDL